MKKASTRTEYIKHRTYREIKQTRTTNDIIRTTYVEFPVIRSDSFRPDRRTHSEFPSQETLG